MKRISITGHRVLANEAEVKVDILYSLQYFQKLYGNLTAISAIASGADTIFSEAAAELAIPLMIELPFSKEEYRNDFTQKKDLEKFDTLLATNAYREGPPLRTSEPEERNRAYETTGRNIVDESDIILAVWDGDEAGGRGGTGDIVEYAKMKNKEIHIIRAVRSTGAVKIKEPLQAKFDELDKQADHLKKKRFQPSWLAGIVAGMIAVCCFAVTKSFADLSRDIKFVLGCAEFLFLLISVVCIGLIAGPFKNKFLEARRGAEFMRSVLWFRDAGIPVQPVESVKYKPAKELIDLENETTSKIKDIENLTHAKRVAWCLAQEQADYHYKDRAPRFRHYLHITEIILKAITFTFLAVAFLSFLFELSEYVHIDFFYRPLVTLRPVLTFLALFLPPAYAALEGVKHFAEWKKNIDKSEAMYTELTASAGKILKYGTPAELIQEAANLRVILESENSEWAFEIKNKTLEVKP